MFYDEGLAIVEALDDIVSEGDLNSPVYQKEFIACWDQLTNTLLLCGARSGGAADQDTRIDQDLPEASHSTKSSEGGSKEIQPTVSFFSTLSLDLPQTSRLGQLDWNLARNILSRISFQLWWSTVLTPEWFTNGSATLPLPRNYQQLSKTIANTMTALKAKEWTTRPVSLTLLWKLVPQWSTS